MRYLSVCSGIEAATVAWHPLGWEAAAFSEIEKFPRAVLSYHYPAVPLHGDFTTIGADEYGPIDLLVGGTPCQSFSIAGLRGGLGDDRGNLALEYLRLAQRTRPEWLVWENVPGVLSSSGGRDFGSILGGMVELGYGIAYRVLDAQFFGVPQRRRRVFVVAYLGDWRRASAVLFERQSLQGHSAPRREAVQVAPTVPSRISAGGGLGTDFDCDGGLIASTGDVAHCLNAGGMGRQDYETETLIAFDARQSNVLTYGDITGPMDTGHPGPAFCFSAKDYGADAMEDCSPTLRAGGHSKSHANAGALTSNYGKQPDNSDAGLGPNLAGSGSVVRRLTPRECERLQGFSYDYTRIPYRGKPADQCPDGPRYKALGNSMAVPVMRWIGERIQMIENLPKESPHAA